MNNLNRNYFMEWAVRTISTHKRRGCKVGIGSADLSALAKRTTNCEYCGRELWWGLPLDKTKRWDVAGYPSLDRVDPTGPVDWSNVKIVCHQCNKTKFRYSHEDFVSYCQRVADYYRANSC